MTAPVPEGGSPSSVALKEASTLRWLISVAARALPIVLTVVSAVAIVAFLLLGGGSSEGRSSARLALTEEVVWPFFDAVVAETASLAASDELRAHLDDTFGPDTYVLTPEIPDDLRAVIDLVVEADSAAEAEEIARAAGDWVVAATLEDRRDQLAAEIDEARAGIAALEAQLTEREAAADDTAAALAGATDPATVADLERELRVTNETIDRLVVARLELELSASDLERRLATLPAEVVVARVETEDTTGRSRWRLAVAVGVGVGLLAAIAYAVHDRERGRISSVDHLRDVLGIDAGGYPASPVATSQLVGLFRPLFHGPSLTIAIDRVAGGAGSPDALAAALTSVGVNASAGVDAGDVDDIVSLENLSIGQRGWTNDRSLLAQRLTLVDLHGPDAPLGAALECDYALLVVDQATERMAGVQRRLKALEELGLPVLGALLVRSR